MLPMRDAGPAKRAGQVGNGYEGGRGLNATWRTRRHLLQQPAVAVGITKRREGVVASRLGRRATDAQPPEQVGLIRACVLPGGVVEHLADIDTLAEKLG